MRFTFAFLLLCCTGLSAQGLALPIGNPAYEVLDRLTIKYGFDQVNRPAFNPSIRPTNRANVVRLLKSYKEAYGAELSATDQFWLQFAFDDNNEWLALPDLNAFINKEDTAQKWLLDSMAILSANSSLHQKSNRPLFGIFYNTPANLFEINKPDFFFRLNPILDLRYGKMKNDAEDYIYNRRGVELRAGVDERIFFYFQILETQRSLPTFIENFYNRYGGLPGAGFVKEYSGLGIKEGVDFLNSQGYISYEVSPHVGLRLGYGDNFIGRGERSLLLSDFSYNYPFLQLNWRIWKFHYQNTFAQLTTSEFVRPAPNRPVGQKYMASHHLSINLGKRLNLGIFESVILSRDNGFELAYLNPVIFYRAVEGGLGSPDNVLIGLDASYRLPTSMELYCQLVLDEFKFDELIQNNQNWWANKWAFQLGLKYIDVLGVDQLDAQVEYNRARPFIYTHNEGENSYTNYGLPLAHPLGANFSDLMVQLKYRPLPRLKLLARAFWIQQGEELDGSEFTIGENINLASNDRLMEYGNTIGQGERYNNNILNLEASFMIGHNLFLEALYYRSSKAYDSNREAASTEYASVGLRWNVMRRREQF